MLIPFYFKFFITNFLFSFIIALGLIHFNGTNQKSGCSNIQLLLFSLGLGPICTVLILYYCLLIMPRNDDGFYFAVIFIIYLILTLFFRKSILILLKDMTGGISEFWKGFKKETVLKKLTTTAYTAALLILLGLAVTIYHENTLRTPLDGHDVLVYGNLGKLYYQQKNVGYSGFKLNKQNGFFFSGSPKPSFSLLLTWEMIMNGLFMEDKITAKTPNTPEPPEEKTDDWYFKSITAYYGLLMTGILFMYLYKENKYLALLGLLMLFSGLRFYIMLLTYHLDSYRMFFLIMSWIFLAYAIKTKQPLAIFLMGLFSGFTAFTHLIGAVIALLNGSALFLFLEQPFKEKLKKTLTALAIMVIAGGIHYLLEALYGAYWGFLTYV